MASLRIFSTFPCVGRLSPVASRSIPKLSRPLFSQVPRVRAYTTDPPSTTCYAYPEIKQMASNPSPDRVLVDVREPGEVEGGAIPTAINIPVSSAPDALLMPEEEFDDKFGFEKPRKDQEVVFYCKAGIRSRAAAEIARQAGYQKVGEYPGSWMDWIKNEGK